MEPDGKSMVVYGVNASGKSSFVDAIEYLLNGGKIGHLSHEYAGKHLENAVPNTHKPQGRKTELSVRFSDNSEANIEITGDGTARSSGTALANIRTWDYRRTVLRQDEVAAFIHDTKGGKYSALLPLLGLHDMDLAAENLRQLAKSVETLSKVRESRATLKEVDAKRREIFGTDTDERILEKIEAMHLAYSPDRHATGADAVTRCADLTTTLEAKISRLSADQRCYLVLRDVAALDIRRHIEAVRRATAKLADAVDPLISEKLAVLQPAEGFVDKLAGEGQVTCPACGQSISIAEFQQHVRSELKRLEEIRGAFKQRNTAMGTLCDAVRSLKSDLNKADVKSWRDDVSKGTLAPCFAYLEDLNSEGLRTACSEDELQKIEGNLVPIIHDAASASASAPPDVTQLLADKRVADAAKAMISARAQGAAVTSVEGLISAIKSLEQATREEIRVRSEAVIAGISADVQGMWAILHPGEAIEHVRLYVPKDTDKAIDIGLKFHGKELESPRLTLSEGYRNSLGLCIFLSMAKREVDKDRPMFLDDVVVSLDRNHRGMIVELLEKKFGARQVIILTHDRDWYAELRQQLDPAAWIFKALLPYDNPGIGIRWSHKTTTFDDARAHLADRPDSAGNDARKIMDVELALIAERLHLRLRYLRLDKNDHRTAHDFLERLVADGKVCFQRREGKDYSPYTGAFEALGKADQLVVSWANRASHSFDVVRPEATKLIEACEKALECLKCASCGKHVWFADAAGAEWVQCQCGKIRWRYGKA